MRFFDLKHQDRNDKKNDANVTNKRTALSEDTGFLDFISFEEITARLNIKKIRAMTNRRAQETAEDDAVPGQKEAAFASPAEEAVYDAVPEDAENDGRFPEKEDYGPYPEKEEETGDLDDDDEEAEEGSAEDEEEETGYLDDDDDEAGEGPAEDEEDEAGYLDDDDEEAEEGAAEDEEEEAGYLDDDDDEAEEGSAEDEEEESGYLDDDDDEAEEGSAEVGVNWEASAFQEEEIVSPASGQASGLTFLDLEPEPITIRGFGKMDAVILAAGLVIVIGGFLFGNRFVEARMAAEQKQAFSEIGSSFSGAALIGGDTISRVADERIRLDREKQQQEEIRLAEEEEQRKAAEEAEALKAAEGTVGVTVTLASVHNDLKIKFLLEEKQTILAGKPLRAEVKEPAGNTVVYEDDDRDGIIYKTEVEPGAYSVRILPFETGEIEKNEQLKIYRMSADAKSIVVTDQLAYKKIDIAGEVKKESEVNVAQEDTAKKDAVVESTIADTVTYVEPSKVEVVTEETPEENGQDHAGEETAYEPVGKDEIPNPFDTASAVIPGRFIRLSGRRTLPAGILKAEDTGELREEGGDNEEEADDDSGQPESGIQMALLYPETAIVTGQTIDLPPAVISGSENQEIKWKIESGSEQVELSGSQITAKAPGEARLRAYSAADPGVSSLFVVHVNGEEDLILLQGVPESVTVQVGKTAKLNASVQGSDDTAVTFRCEDPKIAEVFADGTISGVSAGETVVTVIPRVSEDLAQRVRVIVQTTVDKNARLKDKNGNQLYIRLPDGTYTEALVSDYEIYDVFYRRVTATSEYRYTGWQTIDGKTYYFNENGTYVTGEQTIQGVKYHFGSDGVLNPAGDSKLGIDVSTWNGDINWNAVRNAGVTYAIIRCGFRGSSGGTIIEDSRFRNNMNGAIKAGLKVGVYFYTQAVDEIEAIEEATYVLDAVSGYSLSLPIFLDVESSGGRGDSISVRQRTDNINAFCRTVGAYGYVAGVYSNTNWFSEKIYSGELSGYHIWLAQYAEEPTYSGIHYDLWQYTASGRINGIPEKVDMNISYRNY